ncbi:MAG: hypothetical protein HWE08_13000 [Alphaproteobacteria bacterium]|nr:hypothetical protein [Alphaproteobacteria bacterium]
MSKPGTKSKVWQVLNGIVLPILLALSVPVIGLLLKDVVSFYQYKSYIFIGLGVFAMVVVLWQDFRSFFGSPDSKE